MKKLFISNPMNGKTDEQILAIRQTAVEDAKKYFPGEISGEIYRTPCGCGRGILR